MIDAKKIEAELDAIATSIPDPRGGLPDPVFNFVLKVTPMINVDLLIRDGAGRTLLAWREDPYGIGWHIPGGIIRYRERAETRIAAVAKSELGATVEAEPLPCDVGQFLHSRRGHFISLLYRSKLTSDIDARLLLQEGQPNNGTLGWIEGVPAELYPANRMYEGWLASPR